MDQKQQTFMVATCKPTKAPWLPEWLQGQWNPQKGKKQKRTVEEMPAHSVIVYFAKFNASNHLPKAVKTAVDERNLKWATISNIPDKSESEHSECINLS